mmetsp:Transcript_6558/g.24610  ORF Transcript_6558/g.24610 Transcript_6558/m.24610 type:complete len:265 (-) Transcript_6558:781-1575(-)
MVWNRIWPCLWFRLLDKPCLWNRLLLSPRRQYLHIRSLCHPVGNMLCVSHIVCWRCCREDEPHLLLLLQLCHELSHLPSHCTCLLEQEWLDEPIQQGQLSHWNCGVYGLGWRHRCPSHRRTCGSHGHHSSRSTHRPLQEWRSSQDSGPFKNSHVVGFVDFVARILWHHCWCLTSTHTPRIRNECLGCGEHYNCCCYWRPHYAFCALCAKWEIRFDRGYEWSSRRMCCCHSVLFSHFPMGFIFHWMYCFSGLLFGMLVSGKAENR